MADLDLTPIKDRMLAATSGPWAVDGPWHHEWEPRREDTDQAPMVTSAVGRLAVALTPPLHHSAGETARAADAAFIAHARTDVAALVAEVENLRATLRNVTGGAGCSGCVEYPEETCPVHGRPITDWIDRSDTLQGRLNALDALLDGKDDHALIGVARIKDAVGRG